MVRTILLTGATGYIGGRLVNALRESSNILRCLTRRPGYLKERLGGDVEVVEGDVLDISSLRTALHGVDIAYYLVHSLQGKNFEAQDREGARNFATAAKECGVKRIIYLGGLGRGDNLSSHLESRQEVGRVLRESGVPTLEFRASIIIGSGSLSYEMFRALVRKLPVMVMPRWTKMLAQPIAVEDVIAYLVEALKYETNQSEVFEIGGADQVSYLEIMKEFARQRGLRRLMIPVPVLSPRLSSLWLGLVTPLYAQVGRKLIDSVRNDTVITNNRAGEVFTVRPRGIADAIARALINEDREMAETRWADALSAMPERRTWGGIKFGSRFVDSRTVAVHSTPAQAFAPIRTIGGKTGWYYGNSLWRIRGFIDLLQRGVGLRRGRRDPEHIIVGDIIDFWRVEEYDEDHLLRLYAEMKVPGRAWLQFEVNRTEDGSTIRQTAIFDPAGFLGILYWYSLYPIHELVFKGMLRNIAKAVVRSEAARKPAETHS